jgi:IS30 family transposase
MARFSNGQVAEAVQPFRRRCRPASSSPTPPCRLALIASRARAGVAAWGGVRPCRGRSLKGRSSAFAEREEIALARARGETMRATARRLGRSPSRISRELRANADPRGGDLGRAGQGMCCASFARLASDL